MNKTGFFHRDASKRLCYEMEDVGCTDYPEFVARVVQHFDLKSANDLVVGPDQLLMAYTDGKHAVGLDWDNWSGFFVTAHTPESEALVRKIGAYLETSPGDQ